ncbi:MAG: dTDP-glucose pyrophosphorylase [Desulfobacteraceae bacterium]|nr:dTDP-glucose pyrophosphorylase [Desulfobacteraceae bacterium]
MSEIIGLIPAAGRALRIAPLPCSKEIFPVGIDESDAIKGPRPKAAAQYLLEQMRNAGAQKAYIILRSGKWDIPKYFEDGSRLNLDIAYLIMRRPYGVPYTLDQAYPFVKDATILFGFPDIIMFPNEVFTSMLNKRKQGGCDIVVALFSATQPKKMDMVELDADNNIKSIHIKPPQTTLDLTWIAAAWTPVFTEFMHALISDRLNEQDISKELYIGDVIQAALGSNIKVSSVHIKEGRYLDIGTPEDLLQSTGFVQSLEAHEKPLK